MGLRKNPQVLIGRPMRLYRTDRVQAAASHDDFTGLAMIGDRKGIQGTRMVIKNDGTGGRVELNEGDEWVARSVTKDYLVLKS